MNPHLKKELFEQLDEMERRNREAAGPEGSTGRLLYDHMRDWSLNPSNLWPTNLPQLCAELAAKIEADPDLITFDRAGERGSLEKAVAGAIKSAISSHGPVTIGNHASAAKRAVSAIKTWNRNRKS